MEPGKASRRRGADLEAAILDAAWDVLETSGWNGFTFEGVSERARTSKPVLYRRWRTREDLLRATLRRRGERTRRPLPDTGSLRGDMVAVLTAANDQPNSMAAVVSMRLGAIFEDLRLSPAELRLELLGDRQSSMDLIVRRAIDRGELGPRMPPPRVVSLPIDLFRHEAMMTLSAVPPEVIASIVDDVFLPLAKATSAPDPDEG